MEGGGEARKKTAETITWRGGGSAALWPKSISRKRQRLLEREEKLTRAAALRRKMLCRHFSRKNHQTGAESLQFIGALQPRAARKTSKNSCYKKT